MSENTTVAKPEETEISIAAILALGFNHIKGVLIALCLGIVLLGGWKFLSAKKAQATTTIQTVVTYGIIADNDSVFLIDGKTTPASTLIVNTYISYWKSIDIKSAINSQLSNDKLREKITLTTDQGANPFVRLTITSNSQEECDKLTSAVKNLIVSSKSTVESFSYAHDLNEVSSVNKSTVSEPAVTSKSELIKWAAIGAVLGAFLYCLYLLIRFISKNPVTSSGEFEERTSLVYLGSFYRKRGWNKKTADSILNERVFNSLEAATAFTTENIKSVVSAGQKVLLVSSFYKDEKAPQVASALDIIKNAGCSAVFTGNALVSADFISELSKNDVVIVLEERWNSLWTNIYSVLQVIARKDKKIAGFILA